MKENLLIWLDLYKEELSLKMRDLEPVYEKQGQIGKDIKNEVKGYIKCMCDIEKMINEGCFGE